MLAFNIWRYFKMMAEISNQSAASDTAHSAHDSLKGLKDNLIRIARLKLLLIGAKVVYHSRDRVKYSMMDSRTPGLMHFLNYLDRARARARPWLSDNLWPCRFSVNSIYAKYFLHGLYDAKTTWKKDETWPIECSWLHLPRAVELLANSSERKKSKIPKISISSGVSNFVQNSGNNHLS